MRSLLTDTQYSTQISIVSETLLILRYEQILTKDIQYAATLLSKMNMVGLIPVM